LLKILTLNINFDRNICAHLYINLIWFKFGEGQNYTIFTKIWNKLRQKLKY